MDLSILTMADRLEHHRAADLDRENELLRSIADRGITLSPAHPVVDAVHDFGVWLRNALTRPRLNYSH